MNTTFNGYLFIIYSCKKNLELANKVYNFLTSKTLLNSKIFILYGDTQLQQEFEINSKYLVLNVEDDYLHLNIKTLKLLNTISKLFTNLKGLFKCDDDVIPNVQHLNNFINGTQIAQIDYCGKYMDNTVAKTYTPNYYPNIRAFCPIVKFTAGPLYYLSKKAIEVFNDIRGIQIYFGEDITVGVVLNNNGIYPDSKVDLYTDDSRYVNSFSVHNFNHNPQIVERYLQV